MTVAIIDYGSGNLRSVAKAFERVANHPDHIIVTRSPEVVAQADRIVLPGVGAFADCMNGLKVMHGMLDVLQSRVIKQRTPFLGICVGMQMLFARGHEHGVHEGLGWLEGEVVPLARHEARGTRHEGEPFSSCLMPHASCLKIPHMGWNDLKVRSAHPLMEGIATGDHAYFVHSFYAACRNGSEMLATTTYGQTVAAVVGRGNIMGTQFHPEKSQETGLRLLKNFLAIEPG